MPHLFMMMTTVFSTTLELNDISDLLDALFHLIFINFYRIDSIRTFKMRAAVDRHIRSTSSCIHTQSQTQVTIPLYITLHHTLSSTPHYTTSHYTLSNTPHYTLFNTPHQTTPHYTLSNTPHYTTPHLSDAPPYCSTPMQSKV